MLFFFFKSNYSTTVLQYQEYIKILGLVKVNLLSFLHEKEVLQFPQTSESFTSPVFLNTKGHCYCKTNQGVFAHLLPGKGILLFVTIILSASLISFPMFFGRNPYRCKTQRTHKRKSCILKCNRIFLKQSICQF